MPNGHGGKREGSGKKPLPNARTETVTLRFTAEEKERIKKASTNLSEFCRKAILRAVEN